MENFLKTVVAKKRRDVFFKKMEKALEDLFLEITPSKRNFCEAVSGKRKKFPKLIAEIKKASPSLGIIRKDFDVGKIAKLYNKYASAISVVTEENFFQGELEYISLARESSLLPILAKDFIIDSYQIYEARKFGADAILLIARLLTQDEIEEFLQVARELEMSALVEVQSKNDLIKVLETSAEIIGINNRDLNTFKIDLNKTLELMPLIPKDKIIVSESGYFTREHLEELDKKVNAVLIGTAILKEENMERKLKELVGK